MMAPRRNPAASVAVGVALAALGAISALAQSQVPAGTIANGTVANGTLANGDSIVIDGRTFSVRPGTSNNDLATPTEQLGARRLGAGVIIFRRGDGLYMVERPPTATTADAAARGQPRGLRDMERQRPFDPRDATVDRRRPQGLRDAGTAPGDIDHMAENPRIHVEYQPPEDSGQQQVYDTIRQRHVLELASRIFSPWNLGDIDLYIRTASCGESNAFYRRVDNVPTVTICYEYLQEIWERMPAETRAVNGDTMRDVICGQLFFAIAHELGHAMFDIFDVPVFGRQEDAADEFATYNLLQFGGDKALQLIDGAAYAYHLYIKDLTANPRVTLPFAAFSSDHGAPEERYFNLICIAYGYDQRLFSLAMNKLPASRAKRCKLEYEDLKFAMRTVFGPHIDNEKARQVLAMRWFVLDANVIASTTNGH
jgi:Putative metallopeptidase